MDVFFPAVHWIAEFGTHLEAENKSAPSWPSEPSTQ